MSVIALPRCGSVFEGLTWEPKSFTPPQDMNMFSQSSMYRSEFGELNQKNEVAATSFHHDTSGLNIWFLLSIDILWTMPCFHSFDSLNWFVLSRDVIARPGKKPLLLPYMLSSMPKFQNCFQAGLPQPKTTSWEKIRTNEHAEPHHLKTITM